MIPPETKVHGRDLDALIAERIYGYVWVPQPADISGEHGGALVLCPPNTTWEELEPMLPRRGLIGPHFFVHLFSSDREPSSRLQADILARGDADADRYVYELARATSRWGVTHRGDQWRNSIFNCLDVVPLLSATPAHRARAALGYANWRDQSNETTPQNNAADPKADGAATTEER